MMLVEEGRLRLDEPIDRLAPELANRRVLTRMDAALDDAVPARRPITVEDVLSFRLGWGLDFNPNAPFVKAVAGLPGFGMPNPAWPGDDDSFLRALGQLPLQAQPGEQWLYTLGSNVLGVLVARAARRPLDAMFQERIFAPLGMNDTGFLVPSGQQNRLVTGYVNRNGRLAPFEPWNGLYAQRPNFPAGDSGLVSTAKDYGAFTRFMLSGTAPGRRRLLKPETLKSMATNRLTQEQMKDGEPIMGPGRGWGLGLGVRVTESPDGVRPGAYGWDGGFGTSWFQRPGNGADRPPLDPARLRQPRPAARTQEFLARRLRGGVLGAA
jgi:CubicO group peptidase (beta-lactamase class C family)